MKKTEVPFDGYKWLSKFAAKETTRPMLNTIHVSDAENNRVGYTCKRLAVAADGYRMAIMPVPDETPLGYMPLYNKQLPPAESLGKFVNYMDILPDNLPYILEVNTKDLLNILKTGCKVGDSAYLLWELTDDGYTGVGTLNICFFGTSAGNDRPLVNRKSALTTYTAHIPAVLTDGLEAVKVHGMVVGSKHNNYKLNIAVNTSYLITALEGWKDSRYTLIGIAKGDRIVTLEPDLADNNHPVVVIMLMQAGFDPQHPEFFAAWKACKPEPKPVSTFPKYAMLVYQAGMANVFFVESTLLNPIERNAKRIFQGSFTAAEYFARGLGAAGVCIRTAACNQAGDIIDAEWTNDLESQPFSDKLIDISIN